MRLPYRTILIAGGVALLTGAAVTPVMARGWHDRGPGPGGPGATRMFERFDTNQDGRVTQEEVNNARRDQLTRFDRNGDGQLSLEEYQALWLDVMRPMMVRDFQRHDADGNAQVTVTEFQARFTDMVTEFDRNNDGAVSRDELRPRGRDDGPGRDDRPGQGLGPNPGPRDSN